MSIGSGVTIGPGVRIRESIILSDASIADHSIVLHSIIGKFLDYLVNLRDDIMDSCSTLRRQFSEA